MSISGTRTISVQWTYRIGLELSGGPVKVAEWAKSLSFEYISYSMSL